MSELAPFFPLIAAIAISTIISVIGFYSARKLGLTPAQTRYVETLEGLNDVLSRKIAVLEADLKATKEEVEHLANEIQLLKRQEFALKQENFDLRTELVELQRVRVKPRRTTQVPE